MTCEICDLLAADRFVAFRGDDDVFAVCDDCHVEAPYLVSVLLPVVVA